VRVPVEAVDMVVDAARASLPGEVRLERAGPHGVAAINTSSHEIQGFTQPPWPFPVGPRKMKIKSGLVDFMGSLVELLTESLGRPWPGPNQAVNVKVLSSHASIEIVSDGGQLLIEIPLGYWK
jgi:hypothetical protein